MQQCVLLSGLSLVINATVCSTVRSVPSDQCNSVFYCQVCPQWSMQQCVLLSSLSPVINATVCSTVRSVPSDQSNSVFYCQVCPQWSMQQCVLLSGLSLVINATVSSFSSAFDARSSGRWLLRSLLSTVVRQLAPRAWCLLQCLLAKTVGVLPPGVGRSEECAQGFAPQSHIHSGLNQQDLVSSGVFLAHSDQYADGRWWFGSSCQGC